MRLTLELRTERKDKSGRHPIRIRVQNKKLQRWIGTGLSVDPKHWDQVRQRVKATHPAHQAMNDRLRAQYNAVEVGLVTGVAPRPPKEASGTLADRWWDLIHAKHTNVFTLKATRATVRGLREYDATVKPREVTREWLLKYAAAMKAEGYHPNTMVDRIKRTRQAVEVFRAEDGLPSLPSLRKLGMDGGPTRSDRLNFEEVTALLTTPPVGKWERRAQVLWAVSFYSGGMRFGDLLLFNKSWVHSGWVRYNQSKTGAEVAIPVSPQLQALLSKYKGKTLWEAVCAGDKARSRGNANVMVNRALKSLAKRAGIDAPVSMHWARHSFAEWAMENDTHPVVMMQILGHSKFSTTEIYLKKFNKVAVGSAFGKMFGKG